MAFTADDYLMHHGIKGQKWGVRRYQNPDGTLTESGKKRYGTTENFERAQEKKRRIFRRAVAGTGVAAGVAAGAAGAAAGVKAVKSGKITKESAAGTIDKLASKTIKNGKDKDNLSPAEKVTKDTQRGLENVGDLISSAQRKKQLKSANQDIDLSNEELRSRINRLNMEKQYKDLLRSSSVDVGYEMIKENLNMTASVIGIAASIVGIVSTVHSMRKK